MVNGNVLILSDTQIKAQICITSINYLFFNFFKPEFTIVIHYKPRIAAAILNL